MLIELDLETLNCYFLVMVLLDPEALSDLPCANPSLIGCVVVSYD